MYVHKFTVVYENARLVWQASDCTGYVNQFCSWFRYWTSSVNAYKRDSNLCVVCV